MNSRHPFSLQPNTGIDSLPTQSSLIAKIKFHDNEAWGDFVEIYAPLIFQWCRASQLANEDCSDITQEVFSKLHRAIEKYDRKQNSHFRSWLWVVTRNTIRDYCRKKSRQVSGEGGTQFQSILDNLPAWNEENEPTSERLEQELLNRVLRIVKKSVDSKTWNAFWQVQMENLSSAEVAEKLSMSQNGVRQAKSRVLRRIRDLVDQK